MGRISVKAIGLIILLVSLFLASGNYQIAGAILGIILILLG